MFFNVFYRSQQNSVLNSYLDAVERQRLEHRWLAFHGILVLSFGSLE